jgi:hypothetical protein
MAVGKAAMALFRQVPVFPGPSTGFPAILRADQSLLFEPEKMLSCADCRHGEAFAQNRRRLRAVALEKKQDTIFALSGHVPIQSA